MNLSKKYGSEFEGYPSIVGAGNNGCILHYREQQNQENDLVLMDVGAEYHGYTADVTRTISANGKFTIEQKLIYDLVYEAPSGNSFKVGATFGSLDRSLAKINKGLVNLALYDLKLMEIISHMVWVITLVLGVHDPGAYNALENNMVVELRYLYS
jgi:Xaa-Pro aminopeptidase